MILEHITAPEVLTVAAGICFGIGFTVLRKERAPRRWPQVEGKIATSRVQRQSTGRAGECELLPIIEYEFAHGGRVFKTMHWRVGNFSIGGEDANEITSRYSAGSSVVVYVNEADPMKSVLRYGTTALSWIPIGFGVFFALMTGVK